MNKQTAEVENEEAAAPALISLKSICDELGLKTTSARQKLRSKLVKGEGFRWEFNEADAAHVRELLSAKPEPKAPAEKKARKSKKKSEPVDSEGEDSDGDEG